MANRWGNNENSDRLHFGRLQNHPGWWLAAMKLKDTCSLEEKLWPTLDSILKRRDITFLTKVHLAFKDMVFPVVMYGRESWTIKKAECQRTDAFELRCWQRLLRVPWTARRSNWSILKEISPGCSLEELMLKLKLQYYGYLMWRADSLEKTLMLGKIGGKRKRGRERMRWLDGITDSMDVSLNNLWEFGDGQGSLACSSSWGRKESDTTEQLNWLTDVVIWEVPFYQVGKRQSNLLL